MITKEAPRDFSPVAEGFYEVYVDAVDKAVSMGELEKGAIRLKVRDDVDQPEKDRLIFVNLNTNPNIAWKLSAIATAAGVESGTGFETLDDYLQALKGASMKVKVAHRVYNDKTYADAKSFYPTLLDAFELAYEESDDEDSII